MTFMAHIDVPLQTDIGLSDAELLSYHRNDREVIVSVQLWNGKKALVIFSDVLALFDFGAWSISDFVERHDSEDDFLFKAALSREFEIIPNDHGFHKWIFLDLEGQPCFTLIAKKISIKYE